MHPHAAVVAAGWGADPGAFRSRALRADLVAGAGLVLAASRRERAACVALAPGAMRRTFTLRQFARLADAATDPAYPITTPPPADRLEAAVSAAARARDRLQPVDAEQDDLADPIGQPLAAFHRCAGEIEAALAPTVRLIAACG